jgi:hypothetical protein
MKYLATGILIGLLVGFILTDNWRLREKVQDLKKAKK